ncbi:CrcB family protein [Halomonas denitrificans]|nr:CrcB family protein [Halomonas denitrificans]
MTGPGLAERIAWVGLGSALGGLARFGMEALGGGAFAVFAANLVGAFAIGLYAALSGPDGALAAGPRQRLFVIPGLLAGLTSFSMFSLQADAFLESSFAASTAFVLASLGSWAAGVWAGDALAARLERRLRSVG